MVYNRSYACGLILISLLTACPNIAVGQALCENYRYDALGRLIAKCQATASMGQSSRYDLDRAGNRTRYVSSTPVFTLSQGQSASFPNGKVILAMQGDGNLVVYGNYGSGLVFLGWASNTHGTASDRAAMQADGNLVTYTTSGTPTWNSGTWGNDCVTLYVQDDGNVVIKNSAEEVIWQTGTGGH